MGLLFRHGNSGGRDGRPRKCRKEHAPRPSNFSDLGGWGVHLAPILGRHDKLGNSSGDTGAFDRE
jgi:hypothetical protein